MSLVYDRIKKMKKKQKWSKEAEILSLDDWENLLTLRIKRNEMVQVGKILLNFLAGAWIEGIHIQVQMYKNNWT